MREKAGDGVLEGAESVNCETEKNGLSCGVALSTYKTPLGQEVRVEEGLAVKKVFPLYAAEKNGAGIENIFVLFTRDGTAYSQRYVDSEGAWTAESRSSSDVACVYATKPSGEVISVLLSEEGCKYQAVDGFFSSKSYKTGRAMACYCKNRIFVVTGDKEITYSDPAEPLDATRTENDGGKILRPLDGDKIVDLVANGGTVYAFYSHNIVKITVTGDPREFVVQSLGFTGGEIYGGSVVCVGKWIVFLAFDGVYRFDGEKTERICEYLGVKSSVETRKFGRGRYMDKALLSYLDESGALRTVAIDPERKTGYPITPLEGLTECNGRTLCVIDQKIMVLDEQGANPPSAGYFFKSKEVDFGSAERKTLKTIRLKGSGYIVLSVWADGKEYAQILNLDTDESYAPMARGKKFIFKISLSAGAKVENLEADVAFLKG
jgi:hypothetical protein